MNGKQMKILDKNTKKQINKIGKADIVIGIPSYNNKFTIENVISTLDEGLVYNYSDLRSVIIISDGKSSDETKDISENTDTISDKIVTEYLGIPGKGSAVRAIFETARMLNARAAVMVDADLRSIHPDWVYSLIETIILGNTDFVSPVYSRKKFDATITRLLVYPLIRSLFRTRIQQPIGGDFSFSNRFVNHCLADDVWNTDIARFGIDIYLTISAIVNGFNMLQTHLGEKVHDNKNPIGLDKMLKEVAGTLFSLVKINEDFCVRSKRTKGILSFTYDTGFVQKSKGEETYVFPGTEHLIANMKEKLLDTSIGLKDISDVFLSIKDDNELLILISNLWSSIVYKLILMYNKSVGNKTKNNVLNLLIALYYGRVAGYYNEVKSNDLDTVVEDIAKQFIEKKNDLFY